jgi:hypothetical protein
MVLDRTRVFVSLTVALLNYATPLKGGHVGAVELLCERGANVDLARYDALPSLADNPL